MGVATAVMAGSAILGAGVAIKGQRDAKKQANAANQQAARVADQNVQMQREQNEFLKNAEQKRILAPKEQRQLQLEQQSFDNYQQQNSLAQQQQIDAMDARGYSNTSRNTLEGIQSGEAFALTPEEQQRIDQQRNAAVAYGSNEINTFLNDRLNSLQADAATRGIRGQGYTQLQTGAVNNAANMLQQRVLAANQNAAQTALQMPGQRVATQGQVAGAGLDYAGMLQERAFQNRNVLQNPILLQQMQNERLNTATTKGFPQATSAPVNNYTPVLNQGPSSAQAGLTGALGAATSAVQLGNAFNAWNTPTPK
jgi:hypothetical protein